MAGLRSGQSGFRFPTGLRDFPVVENIQICSTSPHHPQLVPMVKRLWNEANYLYLVPRLWMGGAIPFFRHTATWHAERKLLPLPFWSKILRISHYLYKAKVLRISHYLYKAKVLRISHYLYKAKVLRISHCFWRNSPPAGHGLLIHEISRSHTTTYHSR